MLGVDPDVPLPHAGVGVVVADGGCEGGGHVLGGGEDAFVGGEFVEGGGVGGEGYGGGGGGGDGVGVGGGGEGAWEGGRMLAG